VRRDDRHLDDPFSLVEPADARRIFLSHDDVDRYGNLMAVPAACPYSTTSWPH